jgi:hypothetical protein
VLVPEKASCDTIDARSEWKDDSMSLLPALPSSAAGSNQADRNSVAPDGGVPRFAQAVPLTLVSSSSPSWPRLTDASSASAPDLPRGISDEEALFFPGESRDSEHPICLCVDALCDDTGNNFARHTANAARAVHARFRRSGNKKWEIGGSIGAGCRIALACGTAALTSTFCTPLKCGVESKKRLKCEHAAFGGSSFYTL